MIFCLLKFNNAWYNKVDWLTGHSYLTMIAGNAMFFADFAILYCLMMKKGECLVCFFDWVQDYIEMTWKEKTCN